MFAQSISDVLFQKRGATVVNYGTLANFLGFSGVSGSSAYINDEQALKLSALYCGVNIISNDIAVLPKTVFKIDSKGKHKDYNHPLHYVLSKMPNESMSSFHFHKIMVVTAILRGNAVAIINRDADGNLTNNALTFVHPNDLHDIKLIDGQLWFYTELGVYHNSEVFHIKGFGTNGYVGHSFLRYAASNLNAALTSEQFAEANFKSKGFGLGVIKSEKSLNDDAKKNLSTGMSNRLSAGGEYNIGVLDEGMDYESISVSAKEAELIDWKKISVEDIARWLNLSARKLKQNDKPTYGGVEQDSIDHQQDSILPYVTQFENEYNAKLFSRRESKSRFVKFNINALLRVDIRSRAEYYYKMRYGGIFSGDEIRELEDMNPTGLPHMTEPLQPVQIQQQDQIEKQNNNNE